MMVYLPPQSDKMIPNISKHRMEGGFRTCWAHNGQLQGRLVASPGFIRTLNQPKPGCLSSSPRSRSIWLIPLGRQTVNNGPFCFDETHNCLELAGSSGAGSGYGAAAGMRRLGGLGSRICRRGLGPAPFQGNNSPIHERGGSNGTFLEHNINSQRAGNSALGSLSLDCKSVTENIIWAVIPLNISSCKYLNPVN